MSRSDYTKRTISVSIVIPCFNEEQALPFLIERLNKSISNINKKCKNAFKFEVLFVDDGSRDKTFEIIEKLIVTSKDTLIRCLKLNRNYGHMTAIEAGLANVNSELVITMDADLQDPPEVMFELIRKWQETRADVIQAVRASRTSDSFFKRRTASIYYRFIRRITGVELIHDAADFRLITKRTVQIFKDLPEKQKIFRLLIPTLGLKTEKVYFDRDSRISGSTKYSLSRMLSLTTDSIVAFSSRPLRFISILGLLGFIFFSSLCLYAFVAYFYFQTVPGWTSLVLLILSANSLLLGAIGLIGEYIGRIYETSLGRPRYIIEKDLSN